LKFSRLIGSNFGTSPPPAWIESGRNGTIYRNQNQDGKWSEYTVAALEKNKFFVFASSDGNYSVRYSFKSVGDNATEFEYYEWVNQGDLEEPFTMEILNKLKSVLENLN
jgi:hypothetical protein